MELQSDDQWQHTPLTSAPADNTLGSQPLGRFVDREAEFDAWYQHQVRQQLPVIKDVWIVVLRGAVSRTAQGVAAWERWAIGRYCNGITHVELVFRDTADNLQRWTVDKYNPERDPESGRVRAKLTDPMTMYPSKYWQCKCVSSLTPAESYGLLEFLYRQQGKPMDEWGMKKNFVPLLGPWLVGEPRDEEDAYFCSQLVASAFRWIRPAQFAHVNPRRCTPAQLDQLLDNNQDMFITGTLYPVERLSL